MADTKEGREKQADDADRRQRERSMAEAQRRGDELEPEPYEEGEAAGGDRPDQPPVCHRRGCDEPAAFVVLERYQEDTGHGAVEAEARLCGEHTADERPSNLYGVYADYVFRVTPIPETVPAAPE